ncbi:MAG: NUDIX hydrolase [Saprospiraceae bacterium]|nr:NUDIX hydrolase [Saprospiraceae bacterium]
MQLRRYMLVRLILQDGDKILLLQQLLRNGGKYTLVGGKIQVLETPTEALIRETKEESGAIVLEEDLEFVQYIYQRKSSMINTILVFRARKWTGTIQNLEPHKFGAIGWFSLDALPDRITKSTKHILRHLVKGSYYSDISSKKRLVK